jgi:hypothetical protein
VGKVLVAFRLPKNVALEIKELALVEGVSQGVLVAEALALYQAYRYTRKKVLGLENPVMSGEVIQSECRDLQI